GKRRHERRRPAPARRLGLARLEVGGARLGHVIAPLVLIEVHLLLGVGEDGQVGERPLLAEVRGHRQAALGAPAPEDTQLAARRALGDALLASLGRHSCSLGVRLAVRVAVALLLRLQLHASAFHASPEHPSCREPFKSISDGGQTQSVAVL
uniref:Uncharacterized protein n=1 Tax=Paramormyrops kingsleyae TaxID=1676925 RepID=A0A3B3R820_9TELE